MGQSGYIEVLNRNKKPEVENIIKINFLQKVVPKIVLVLDDNVNYGAKIGKKANITSAALGKTLKKLEEKNIITTKLAKNNRTKIIKLTQKGEEIKKHLEEIIYL